MKDCMFNQRSKLESIQILQKKIKEQRLEELRKQKSFRRSNKGFILLYGEKWFTQRFMFGDLKKLLDLYKSDVQTRWDKRKHERLIRNLQSFTSHVEMIQKRRM